MTVSSRRLLVLDDELAIRGSLAAYFEDLDYQVAAVASTEEALVLLDSESFDVAIVDIRLPGKDGVHFIRCAHRSCPGMKFLIYTGSANFELEPDLEKLGLTDSHVFQKPVSDMKVLLKAIRVLVAS